MSFCAGCGAQLPGGAGFCGSCGRAANVALPPQGSPAQPQSTNININVGGGIGRGTSPLLAAALALFFGPLGMLYSTVSGAIVMFLVDIALLVVSVMTLGIGSVLYIVSGIAGIIWAIVAANSNTSRSMTIHVNNTK